MVEVWYEFCKRWTLRGLAGIDCSNGCDLDRGDQQSDKQLKLGGGAQLFDFLTATVRRCIKGTAVKGMIPTSEIVKIVIWGLISDQFSGTLRVVF